MNRNRIIIGVAAVLVLALLGFLLLYEPKLPAPATAVLPSETAPVAAAPATEEPPPPASAETAPDQPSVTQTTEAPKAEVPKIEPAAPAPAAPTATATPPVTPTPTPAPAPTPTAAPEPPSFDVVRVEPSGEAVLAGRAVAGSDVTVLDGAASLGNVQANPQGQWAYVVETPLAPGSHELGLRARLVDGRVIESSDVVVVNVPHPQIAAAPQPPQPAAPAATGTAAPLSPEAGTAASAQPLTAEPTQPLAVLMPRSGQGPSQVLQQTAAKSEGLGEGTLILETVDYDEQSAVIGGRAVPGARLLVYLDDALLGQAEADAGGRWRLALDRPLTTGLHRLRVDQVDADGKVLARVETPFSRAALVATLPDQTSVVVQPGNSLWRIARRVYGEGVRYAVIYEANRQQIREADLIYPGQIFIIPAAKPAAN